MTTREPLYTLADFSAFVAQPENANRLFELIHGQIKEVSPGRTRNSEYRDIISHAVWTFCEQKNRPCHTSGEAGAYQIGDDVLVPDFAYKATPMSDDYPDPTPPLWVVEIISPTDKPHEIRDKRLIYRRAGILLWEVYPESRSIDVYAPGLASSEAGISDTLDAGDVLPGFTLSLARIFRVNP